MDEILAALRRHSEELKAVETARRAEAEQHHAAWVQAERLYKTPLGEAQQARAMWRAAEVAIQEIEATREMFGGLTPVMRGEVKE